MWLVRLYDASFDPNILARYAVAKKKDRYLNEITAAAGPNKAEEILGVIV